MRIIMFKSHHFGPYVRKHIIKNRRWASIIGVAIIPRIIFRQGRRWWGVGVMIPTDPPEPEPEYFEGHGSSRRPKRIYYHPLHRD